jgi:hypothetical protein
MTVRDLSLNFTEYYENLKPVGKNILQQLLLNYIMDGIRLKSIPRKINGNIVDSVRTSYSLIDDNYNCKKSELYKYISITYKSIIDSQTEINKRLDLLDRININYYNLVNDGFKKYFKNGFMIFNKVNCFHNTCFSMLLYLISNKLSNINDLDSFTNNLLEKLLIDSIYYDDFKKNISEKLYIIKYYENMNLKNFLTHYAIFFEGYFRLFIIVKAINLNIPKDDLIILITYMTNSPEFVDVIIRHKIDFNTSISEMNIDTKLFLLKTAEYQSYLTLFNSLIKHENFDDYCFMTNDYLTENDKENINLKNIFIDKNIIIIPIFTCNTANDSINVSHVHFELIKLKYINKSIFNELEKELDKIYTNDYDKILDIYNSIFEGYYEVIEFEDLFTVMFSSSNELERIKNHNVVIEDYRNQYTITNPKTLIDLVGIDKTRIKQEFISRLNKEIKFSLTDFIKYIIIIYGDTIKYNEINDLKLTNILVGKSITINDKSYVSGKIVSPICKRYISWGKLNEENEEISYFMSYKIKGGLMFYTILTILIILIIIIIIIIIKNYNLIFYKNYNDK